MVQHDLNNPPAHDADDESAAKMNILVHPKGPMWIYQNGVSVNLGVSDAIRCTNNNGLPAFGKSQRTMMMSSKW
jgi:hypothetical protein